MFLGFLEGPTRQRLSSFEDLSLRNFTGTTYTTTYSFEVLIEPRSILEGLAGIVPYVDVAFRYRVLIHEVVVKCCSKHVDSIKSQPRKRLK